MYCTLDINYVLTIKKNKKNDVLFLNCFFQDGSFEVPITAVLPQVDITIPQFLDFSMCAAKDSVETIFEVTNTG